MSLSDNNGAPPGPLRDPGTAIGLVREYPPPAKIVFQEPPPMVNAAPSGGMEIMNLLRVLFRRKYLILSVLVLGLAVSALLTLRVTPLYRATVTLEVQARETQIIQGASVEPATVADAEFMGTQIALLTSRALAERVAENLNLVNEPAYAYQDASPEQRLDQAASVIVSGIMATPLRGARVIDVTYVSTQAAETARIANAVAENFIEMTLDRRYSATAYARRFLEERLAITKTALEDTERKLVEYSSDQEILDLSSVGGSDIGSSLDASALVSVSASLTTAQQDRILAEQKYKEAQASPTTRDMLESPAMQALRQTRSSLTADYQTKLSSLRPEHPEMLELKARIASIENEIEGERDNIVKALGAEYKATLAREQALTKRVEELKDQVQGLRGRSIEYNILRREADTLRTQYDALLQRMKEVSIASGVGSSQVSILDRAQPAFLPFEPNLGSALVRALALSLAAGIALALFIEFLDDRVRTPEDIATKLGIRVIGVIPKVKTRQPVSKLIMNPRESVSEAFSSARTALQFAIIAGSIKSFLVTGSRPSEGKTTTTMALASSFAAIGKKVLIIDGDLRRPSFSYAAGASAGLSGVLMDGFAFEDQVIPGPTSNLYLLPSGAVPPNPAELLAGTRLVQLMEEARKRFDLIFIDSPPVLTFADAPILSSVCDATIVVIQSSGVFRQTVRRSIERLLGANAKIAGAILTKFDPRKVGYGTAYNYGYGYGGKRGRPATGAPADARRIRYFAESGASRQDTLLD